MQIAIETNQLSKKYRKQNGRYAVEDLCLQIPAGQLFGLLGPDGAGKTTTLRILSTVMVQTSGSARVLGHDTRRDAEGVRRVIGYMPQNFSLYPDLRVIENLRFFANIHQVPAEKRRERISKMLSFTRLEGFQDRHSGNLSGGMKKKVALACALMHKPRVLLLDEPSTGVDPVSRRELWTMLAEVVQEGVTMLVSTPYMDEAERCQTVGVVHGGKLLEIGSPADLQKKLPFTILEVKARPRRAMRRIVTETSGIDHWRPVGDRLRLAVKNPHAVARKLRKGFTREAMDIDLLREAKPTMDDVFVYLMRNGRVRDG